MIKKVKSIGDIRKLTKQLPLIRYVDPDFVYISTTNTRCNKYEMYVQSGDKVKVGSLIGKRFGDFFEQNIHSTVSGVVVGMVKKFHRKGKMIDFLKIENDKLDTFDESVFIRSDEDIYKLTKEEITRIVKECSLVGLGGSSFPTYIKFETTDKIDTILINGIECEPYLSSDYRLMAEFPDRIMKGISYAMHAFNASKAIICIKKKHKDLFEILTAVKDHYPQFNIEIKRLGNYYPQGWEVEMIRKALKIKINGLPSKYGVVNFNVSTIVGLYKAIKYNLPVVKRNFSLNGDGIKYAQNYRVRIGTSVKELIEKCGGYVDCEKDKVFIMGGPMMGASIVSDDAIITKTTTSVIILNKEDTVIEPCIRCASCVYSCPVHLSPVQIMNAVNSNDVETLKYLNPNKCIECGLCSYGCTSRIKVTDFVRKAKKMIKG